MSAAARGPAPAWLRLHVAACALLALVVGALHAPWDTVLREDALAFLDQVPALRAGDWTAQAHPVGWPALLALVASALGLDAPFDLMSLSRALSVLLLAACVVPFAALARRGAGDVAAALTALALATTPALLHLGTIAYADPCFLLLAACGAATAAGADGRTTRLALAAALVSLAYAVKPNALFLLVALVPVAWLQRRRAGAGALAATATVALLLAVFVLVSLPHLWARAQTFGSPMSYGENSKYFVDSYAQVWDRSVPVPSLGEYLATHSPAQWWHKFGRSGLLKVGWYWLQAMGPLWTLLLALAAWTGWRADRRAASTATTPTPRGRLAALVARLDRPLLLPALWLAVSLAGLIPVFHIFGDRRYLVLTLPLVVLLSCAGFATLSEGWRRRRAARLALAALLLAQLPLAYATGDLRVHTDPTAAGWTDQLTPRLRDAWATWTVRQLPSPVALVEGGDLLRLAFDQARAVGDLPAALDVPGPYRTRRPGAYPDLGAALDDLYRKGVRHLLVDRASTARRPFLADLDDPRWADRVERLRVFEQPADGRWLIPDMTVWRLLPPAPGRR